MFKLYFKERSIIAHEIFLVHELVSKRVFIKLTFTEISCQSQASVRVRQGLCWLMLGRCGD